MAIVENKSDHGGQTVTVNFNLLDKAGEVIASTQQVEHFGWAGQTLPVLGWFDIQPQRAKAAESVEATVHVQDDGAFSESEPMKSVKAKIGKQYGQFQAQFKVSTLLPTRSRTRG